MAAIFGQTEYGLEKTGSVVSVADTPRSKLMYYLNCICTILDMDDEADISRLMDYTNYHRLNEEEVDALVALCFLLSPDVLNDKVMFQDDDMCGETQNEFYELSAVRTNMLLSESILIGGQTRTVKEVMFYKQSWVEKYWTEPMRHFSDRLAQIAAGGGRQAVTAPSRPAIEYSHSAQTSYNQSNSDDGCCCTIL